MTGLRVLSVRQPWAWSIVYAGKDVENRSRSLGPYRGPVLIHASLQVAADDRAWEVPAYVDALASATSAVRHRLDVRGAIIGVVDLVDVHRSVLTDGGVLDASGSTCAGQLCSPWAEPEAHHLVLRNPRALDQPLAWTGGLGLRKAPGIQVYGDWLVEVGEGCKTPCTMYGCPPGCYLSPLSKLEAVSRG